MERAGDRQKKMAGYCSTGQSPQRAVVLMEEEELIISQEQPLNGGGGAVNAGHCCCCFFLLFAVVVADAPEFIIVTITRHLLYDLYLHTYT